jgi:hypothetical protein
MESHQKAKKPQRVKSKAYIYECMLRNLWYLPSFNSSLITVQYMIDIKEGSIWCPRYDYLKLRPCPRRPLKCFILEEVLKELDKFKEKRITGIDDKHQPDVEWLLVVLATLNPNHRFFAKDYVPSL